MTVFQTHRLLFRRVGIGPVDRKLDHHDPFAPGPLRPFIATTDRSAPVPRIGTLGLAGSPLVPFPWHRDDRFRGSMFEPDRRSRRLKAGCRAGRKQVIANTFCSQG